MDIRYRCPVSGTVPPPEGFQGGYYYDGGFHHCSCGAVVEWTARPSEGGEVSDHEDASLRSSVALLRGMPRADVLDLLDNP